MPRGLLRQDRTNIELHYENREGRVRVVPPDNDIMALNVEVAIEACRAFKQQILFKNQFDHLVGHLAEWIDANSTRIEQGFLTVRDSGLLFLVVTKSNHFDDEIESALTELDLEVSHDPDFNLISLGVHAIPNTADSTIRSFVSSRMAVRFVRNGERS